MSIYSLLSIVNTFGFIDPVASNNWSMYWLSLLVDNPSIHLPTAILLATVRYTGIFRHIHCMPLGCATITPNHPGFRIYLDSRLPSVAQKFVFHSYSIQMDKSWDKGLIEDPPGSGRRLQEIRTTLRTMTIPRWDLKSLFRLISLGCSFK